MSEKSNDWPEFDLEQEISIDSLKEEEKLAGVESNYAAADVPERAEKERHMSWLPGAILIAIGSYFLLNNFTDFHLNNWWALFILIPAFGSFGKALNEIRATGRINGEARGALIGGSILLLVASAFLFNLDWALIWPFFLIIGGLGALIGAWAGE